MSRPFDAAATSDDCLEPAVCEAVIEQDLGHCLAVAFRGFVAAAGAVLSDVPGGPRGHQVLLAAGSGRARSQLALAQLLGVDRTVMTYLIDDLEQAGLVERRRDPADRRTWTIVVTDAGATLTRELTERIRTAEHHLLGPLEPAEQEALRDMLARVAAAIREPAASACQVAKADGA